ncbi:MAG TPA: anti-sigma factor [Mycobacterium sp.]|nr:anti-sigma factor [Mycobacterium sp.]
MTEPTDFDLLSLATPYALHAVAAGERTDIDRRIAAAPPPVAQAFADEIRAVHETMALVSAATAAEPPASLRHSVMAVVNSSSASRSRRRAAFFASVAAIIVGLAAFGAGIALRPAAAPTVADQVLAAPDVRTVSSSLATGTATVLFSRNTGAGVLVMNNVPPPEPGTVYQMWLLSSAGAASAGTMDTQAVAPSTTAVIPGLGDSSALGFTVEPGTGSPQPTGQMLIEIPLR